MEVTAVIPNWNGRELLVRLLEQLRAQTRPLTRVVVVDNGSSDGSREEGEARGAEVVPLPENRGFAAAVNRGIELCRTPLVAILNNDVVLAPDWLERLAAAFAADKVWFACGKVLRMDGSGRLDGAFDALSRAACAWRCGSGRPDAAVWNQPREVEFAPMTAAVFRSELFRRLGTLEEAFESYLEDVDFGLRCASNGYSGRYVPEAVAWHAGSATLGRWHPRTVRQIARNQLLLVARHYPAKSWRHYGWPIAVGQGLWGLVALRHGSGLAYLRGKIEGLRLLRRERRAGAKSVGEVLARSEQQILDLQREAGFDPYWRWYFRLTRARFWRF